MWLSQESKVTATTSLQWRIGGFQSVVRYSKWTPKGICEKKDKVSNTLRLFSVSQVLFSFVNWVRLFGRSIKKHRPCVSYLYLISHLYLICYASHGKHQNLKISCNAILTFDPLSIPSVFIGWTLLVPVSWSTHTIWHLLHLPCVYRLQQQKNNKNTLSKSVRQQLLLVEFYMKTNENMVSKNVSQWVRQRVRRWVRPRVLQSASEWVSDFILRL